MELQSQAVLVPLDMVLVSLNVGTSKNNDNVFTVVRLDRDTTFLKIFKRRDFYFRD